MTSGLLDGVQLTTGADEAQKLQDEYSPAGFERTAYLTSELKNDGDSVVVRFLQDHQEWTSVLQHQFVPTKRAPKGASEAMKKNWPSTMGAVCRKDPKLIKAGLFPDGCYICDHMTNAEKDHGKYIPATRVWTLAVKREKLYATAELAGAYGMTLDDLLEHYECEEGDFLGIDDVMITVDERDAKGELTGNKIQKPQILVVNMALKNFFTPLKGFGQAWGTILHKDWTITRVGEKTDTDYNLIPEEPVEVERNGETVTLDLRLPELEAVLDDDGNETGEFRETGRQLRDYYFDAGPTIMSLIEKNVDDERYHKFFDERVSWEPPKKNDGGGEKPSGTGRKLPPKPGAKGSSGSTAAPASSGGSGAPEKSSGPSAASLRSMRERTRAASAPKAEEAPAEAPFEPEGEQETGETADSAAATADA